MKKILKLLNLDIDENQKWILIPAFVIGLVMTYTSPVLVKEIIGNLPSKWIAFQSLFSAGMSFLVGIIWKGNFRKGAIQRFVIFCIIESLAGFILGMYLVFISYSIWVYAIASLIYSTLVSEIVGKCILAFKSKLWNERGREKYDNNSSIVGCIVCLAGYTFAILFEPSVKTSVFLWGLCCLLDNLGWIKVYFKNKELLKIDKEEN